MGPSLTPLAWRGHRYDLRMPGAAIEWLSAKADVDRSREAGRDVGLAGLFALEAHEIVLAHARDVHEHAEDRSDGRSCTCGLIVPPGVALTRATGHLDQRRWEPVDVVVVTERGIGRGWEEEPTEAAAYCQACGWVSPAQEVVAARRLAAGHRCRD